MSYDSSSVTVDQLFTSSVAAPYELQTMSSREFRSYKRRWFMLFVVCLLNFANAVVCFLFHYWNELWICYAPVANFTDSFYCTSGSDCDAANWLSIVFMIISIPVGVLAMWSVDKFGLRLGILLGSWVNFTGSAVRVLSSLAFLPTAYRFPMVLVGQCISAAAQPFLMYLPTKLAALWFAGNQRALANTLGSMSNPLGILVANAVSPFIVSSSEKIWLLNVITAAPCAMAALISTLGVWSSVPRSPPSSSAAVISEPFWRGLKLALKNKPFIVLVLCLGGGMGVFNAVYTVQQQILCAKGYSNNFAGMCGALIIGGGILGSLIAGIILDKTKRFEEIIKISICGAALAITLYSVASLHQNMPVLVAFANTIFGAFGFSAYPAGLECGVEVTYPVAEATSAGLIIISGQIQGVLYVLLMQGLQQNQSYADSLIETCTTGGLSAVDARDMSVSNMTIAGITCAIAVVITIFFWPSYKRLEMEHIVRSKSENLLRGSNTPRPATVGAEFDYGVHRERFSRASNGSSASSHYQPITTTMTTPSPSLPSLVLAQPLSVVSENA